MRASGLSLAYTTCMDSFGGRRVTVESGSGYTRAFEFLDAERLITGWVLLVVGTVAFSALWWFSNKPWQAIPVSVHGLSR